MLFPKAYLAWKASSTATMEAAGGIISLTWDVFDSTIRGVYTFMTLQLTNKHTSLEYYRGLFVMQIGLKL